MTPLAPPFGHPRSGKKGFVPRDPILGTVGDLAATAGDGAVVLTFSTPVGATKYLPQYKLSSSGTWLDAADADDPPNISDASVEHTVGSLTNDSAYDFRVQVFDLFGSTTSGSVSQTPTATAGFGTVNDLAVKATQTDTTLEFEWTQVADDLGNAAKYLVRIRTPTLDSGTWGEAFGSEIAVDTDLAIGVTKSVQFTGLTAGTGYEALLIPFRGPTGNADEFGSFSNSAAGTTTGTTALGTISDLAASPGDTEVVLTWSPAENATSHQPQYKLSSSGTWLDFGSALGVSASAVTVTGLTNDSSYDFRIEAGDGVTTTNSNTATTTPTASTFKEPAGFAEVRSWDGSSLTPTGWGEADNGPSSHSLEAEGGLPSGNANLYRRTYPAGMSLDGKGTEFIFVDSPWDLHGPTEIYFRFWLRPDTDWVGHSSGVNKVCYWGSNAMYLLMRGSGTGSLRLELRRQAPSPAGAYNFTFNDGANAVSPTSTEATITRGSMNLIEVHQIRNTDGNADGELYFWLDGVQIGSFTGFEFYELSQFRGWSNDGIYGGRDTGTLAATQLLDYDGFYISQPV